MNQRLFTTAIAAAIALAFTAVTEAQEISGAALAQMKSIASTKSTMTAAQRKMDSALVFGIYRATNDPRVASYSSAITPLSATDATSPSVTPKGITATANSLVAVSIVAPVSAGLNSAIAAANGRVIHQSTRFGVTDVALPVTAITAIAARSDVTQVKLPILPSRNVGALTSQGYVSHAANTVVSSQHIDGTGVTVGVLSDSASASRLAALKASGDVPQSAYALAGQDGSDQGGEDEGAAMMEIIHDMAPGANLVFATAFISESSFADNIIALANAGCKVIVDDVSYFDEGAFQDGIVAQAVNQVTAAGVTYFSSAANSGSLTKGTSGTWEGDFKDGGAVTGVVAAGEGGVGRLHNFGTTATMQNYDVLNSATSYVTLKWSDPLGASSNDYDLFVLDPTETSVLGFGGAYQDGTVDPFEIAYRNDGSAFPAGSHIVVVQYAGAARALHLDTLGGTLSIATSGATYGHNAGAQTVSVAATYWNSAKTGTKAFTGAANVNETFSSDGPRKIFYNPNGTAITPGNLLFTTGGGTTLQKPDVAAADGVSTKTPGFLPFFGTSAAAPHAAGIAALVLAAQPGYTPDKVKTALRATALDSMGAGIDRDSGYGIAMANGAVQYAIAHP